MGSIAHQTVLRFYHFQVLLVDYLRSQNTYYAPSVVVVAVVASVVVVAAVAAVVAVVAVVAVAAVAVVAVAVVVAVVAAPVKKRYNLFCHGVVCIASSIDSSLLRTMLCTKIESSVRVTNVLKKMQHVH
jgi:hypothetical protein